MARNRPGLGVAAFVSIAAAAATLSVMYAGAALLGTPFAPFAVVDWLARHAPSSVVTFSIESIVAALQRLGVGDLSTAAKTGEQLSGVVLVFLVLTAAGVVLLIWPGRSGATRRAVASAVILGALLAGATLSVRPSIVAALWTMVPCVAWGALLGRSRERLISGQAPEDRAEAIRLDRRRFIVRFAGASATITVAGAVVYAIRQRRRFSTTEVGALWSATHPLPNADADVTPAHGTRPELTPLADHYRIDINTSAPVVDGPAWRLGIHGLVDRPLTLTLDDVRRREAVHQFITLACISNPIGGSLTGTTRWSGVPLGRLLDDAGLQPTASHLLIRSADGFDEVVAIDLVRSDARVMLAYEWDGVPLTPEHGFPLRIYIPDRYGMKQPKWIEDIEVIAEPREGYWVRRGWSREARMQITSVIDTVATDMMNASGATATVPVGGIAHAGVRGISRVDVRVDNGAWQPAQLRRPLSPMTWVLWRYDWPFQAGQHTLTVRCTDGTGAMQIVEPSAPHPSGATGLDEKKVML